MLVRLGKEDNRVACEAVVVADGGEEKGSHRGEGSRVFIFVWPPT